MKKTLGIDLGGTKVLLLCDDLKASFKTGISFTPANLIETIKHFIRLHNLTLEQIGLAVPGLVNAEGIIAECDVLPLFKGWSATKRMQGLAAKIAVINDVKAALLEEMHAAPADTTGGVIMVGTAIGAAFITQGQPLLGANGWAGELGYLPIAYKGQVKRLDELAGGATIAAALNTTPETVYQQAQAGDETTLHAIQQAGTALGLGLAAVINLLNPSKLLLGGGTLELPNYWEAALASAKQHSLPELWQSCTLAKVKAGKNVVALGAIRAANNCF